MSHEISSVAWVGERPWHGLGIEVQEEMTSSEAIIKGGLDWTVSLREIQTSDGLPITSHRAVFKDNDNTHLGIVGNVFSPVQNSQAFTFMDSLVSSKELKYCVVGSLSGYKKVWLLAQMGQFEVVPDDMVGKFLFLYNSHDGKKKLRCLITPIRVVCANTAAIALSEGKGEGIALKHTGNIMLHLVEAKKILGFANKQFDKYEEESKILVAKQINSDKLEEALKLIVPDPPEGINPKRAANARTKITELFEAGRGQNIKGVSGTAWALESAVVEFANYFRTARGENPQDSRFTSSLLGPSAELIQDTRKILLAA